jgi:DNA mismatch repair ATPase MutS
MSTSRPANSARPSSTQPKFPPALENLGAREVLFPADLPLFASQDKTSRYLRTELEDWIFSYDYGDRMLRDHFHLLTLDGQGLAGRNTAICAAGAILHYLRGHAARRARPSSTAPLTTTAPKACCSTP